MMFRKFLLLAALTSMTLAASARANESRALLTTENKFPERSQLELSYLMESTSFDNMDYASHSVVARYGLWENLTARLKAPFVQRDEDFGPSNDGLGDLHLGFDLLAYEDIFGYPYVIPHVDLGLPTGDEDKGLGTGDASYSFGVSIGTVVYEVLHYVLDGTYVTDYDTKTAEPDDAFLASLSVIWDVSKRFSFMGEGRLIDFQDGNQNAGMLGGGLSYAWTENLGTTLAFYGYPDAAYGEDKSLTLKVSYSF